MATLNIGFWNVQNLFEPGVVDRGPQSQDELDEKIAVLAGVIDAFFAGDGPDALGLAEVHTESTLESLVESLRDDYVTIWEPPGMADQSGLGLILREAKFAEVEKLEVQRPSAFSRPRSMIARCTLQEHPEPFLLSVNHWKSRLGRPENHQLDRLETADWLGNYLANESRETTAIVIGDFNAEPYEPPFGELRLRAKRNFSNARWSNATPAYLYNTAWRFLTEPDRWEEADQPDYVESRPKTTHGDSGINVFDHIMVSGRALRGGPLTLRERTVELFSHPLTLITSRTGVLRPRKWRYGTAGDHQGSSDHFPLLASFEIAVP